jgi:hypothetical protein
MKVIWTKHSKTRQKEWEKKLEISINEVEDCVKSPEQIVPGDMDVLIAQKRTRDGLLRIPYLEVRGNRKIITIYWTSKVKKYWKEKDDEDKV